jgi:hypothetical protein
VRGGQKLLDFGFRTQLQTEITINYFTQLLKQMERIDRCARRLPRSALV